jgi:hypothetical protein
MRCSARDLGPGWAGAAWGFFGVYICGLILIYFAAEPATHFPFNHSKQHTHQHKSHASFVMCNHAIT